VQKVISRGSTMAALLVVTAISITSALAAGRFSHRWGTPTDLVAAGKQIAAIPNDFGDWELQNSQSLEPYAVEMLQCVGNTRRIYRNRRSGQIVTMFVIVGPAGPTSVHTPEICYSSRDYDIAEPRARFSPRESQQPEDSFWGLTMRGKDLRADLLRVAYAWNSGDGWRAPEQPRFTFGSQPLLYKLQVAGTLSPQAKLGENDPCRSFLQDFLPVLDSALFQPSVGQRSPL
jgi:hypothetical protein